MGIRNVFTRNARRVQDPHAASPEQQSHALRTALITVIVLMGIGLGGWALTTFTPDQQDNTVQPAPAVTPAVPERPEAAEDDPPPNCLNDDPEGISATAPVTESWIIEGFGAVPEVPGAGPCNTLDTGFRVGFAHTMTGALVAAQWYSSTIAPSSPDKSSIENFQQVMVPGPNREGILATTEAILDGEQERSDAAVARSLEVAGYRFLSYEQNEADIQLAYVSSVPELSGQIFSVQIKLLWIDNDWKVVPISTSDWGTAEEIASLDSFVEWGPRTGGN